MTKKSFKIRSLIKSDWPEVSKIYLQGILTQNATFALETPTWNDWDEGHLQACRFVVLQGDQVVGWAALSPVSKRHAYRGVTEVSVYIDQNHWHKGIGKQLLSHLITASEDHGIWTLTASVFPENKASVFLHQHFGFEILGIRKKIGQLHGVWRDTVILERRSGLDKFD